MATKQRKTFSSGLWIKKRKNPKGSERQLFKWDEKLCRLVSSSTSSSSTTDNTDDDESSVTSTEASTSCSSSNSSTVHKVVEVASSEQPLRVRRSFGGNKRRRVLAEHSSEPKNIVRSSPSSKLSEDSESPPSTTSTDLVAFQANKLRKTRTSSKSRPSSSELDFPESENNSKPILQQLSSQSSMEAAKDYFQKIDKEPLTVSSIERPKTTQRTLRRVSLDEFKQEYQDYRKACQQSMVPPYSPRSFLRDRDTFLPQKTLKAFLDVI